MDLAELAAGIRTPGDSRKLNLNLLQDPCHDYVMEAWWED